MSQWFWARPPLDTSLFSLVQERKFGIGSETWPWFSEANKRRSPVGYAFLGKWSDLCVLFCLNLAGLGRVLLFVWIIYVRRCFQLFSTELYGPTVGTYSTQRFLTSQSVSKSGCSWKDWFFTSFHDDIFPFSNEKLIHRELFFLSQSKNESQMHTCVHAKPLQSYMTLCNLTAVAARLLCPWESPGKDTWVAAIPSSRGSSQPRNQTWVCLVGGFLTTEPLGKPQKSNIP